MTATFIRLALIVLLLAVYYGVLVRAVDSFALRLALRGRWPGRFSIAEIEAATNLTVATLFQLLTCAALFAIQPVPREVLFGRPVTYPLLLMAVLIGLGQTGLSSFLSHIVLRVLAASPWQRARTATAGWDTARRAGWVRLFINVLHSLSPLVVMPMILLYIAVEELIFRGIVLHATAAGGPAVAVATTTLLFAAAQPAGMPDALSALFPVVGGIVVGVTNALLMLAVPNILLIVVAHFVFFLVSAMTPEAPDVRRVELAL